MRFLFGAWMRFMFRKLNLVFQITVWMRQPMMKAATPKSTILIPFSAGFFFPCLPKQIPATNRIASDSPTEIQLAVSRASRFVAERTSGTTTIPQHTRGVRKLSKDRTIAYIRQLLVMVVLSSFLKRAFSISTILRSRSIVSDSQTLTPVDMPSAMLLVTSVPMIRRRSGLGEKAEPMITPRSR